MALKTCPDNIKNNAIKKYDNQDLSKQDNNAENKKKFKLRKRKSWSQKEFYELDFCAEINKYKILFRASSPGTIAMASYFNLNDVYSNYNLPYTLNTWDTFMPQVPNAAYTIPVPTMPVPLITPPPPLPTLPPTLPYADVLFTTYPSVVSYATDNVVPNLEQIYQPVSSFAALTPVTSTDEEFNEISDEIYEEVKHQRDELLEYYLTLPKNLFPAPKMVTLDPNPIIDDLCKIKDINKLMPWILDLEFGVPKVNTARPVAVYDVQFNNIHCRDTAGAVHPGFDGCSEDFKRLFLFYYDCIVSVWYRGFIRLTNDDSVKNFQNWLAVPMQCLGMCWP